MANKYRLVCSNCQYTIDVNYEELSNYDECPLCKGIMAYDMTTEEANKGDFVDRVIINQMEKEIKALGNQKCYSVIQNLAEAKVRTRYLHYFLLAGGEVPKKPDLIIEKEGKFFLDTNGGENEKTE